MIVPVGERFEQMLYLFTKKNNTLVQKALRPTLFVPMMGEAEQGRKVQPDPLHPEIVNGSFEERVGAGREPRGWSYGRRMQVEVADDAPDGSCYLKFSNDVPGRMSSALQGFAVDGKSIAQLEVSAVVRGRDIALGQTIDQVPAISFDFYDNDTSSVGRAISGPFRGTFDWKHIVEKLTVPAKATKCVVHIGLLGGTGEFCIDNISLRPIAR